MSGINAGLLLGLAGALSGVLMAALALAMSRAPGWTELRSFALVALTAAAYCVFGLHHVVPLDDREVLLGERLTLASSFVYGLVWIRYFAIVARRPLKRWERATMVTGVVLVLLALVPDVMIVPPIRSVTVDWFGVTYAMASTTLLAIVGVAFTVATTLMAAFGTGRRWSEGWHARLPIVGASALAATGVSDTIGTLEIVPVPQLIEAVTVVVVGAIGASYARRFIDDARRLEALSEGLERVVAERTTELLAAQAAAATNEKLAGLGRIAAGVAHEINNPTAVIQHNVDHLRMQLAERGLLSPELADRLDRSRDATRRIADIVRQLLKTSRGHAPAGTSTTVFEVVPVVERALSATSISAPELRVEVRVAHRLCAKGEPDSLEQVLINLFLNAAHAIIDHGPGIPESIRGRLFEPFSTTKAIGEGTGLGLAVSRSLMTRQGGSLEVTRTSSDGTEIALSLPAAKSSELPATVAATAAVEAAPPAISEPTIHVLVIEDNEDLREVLTMQLERFFRITTAASVDQALAIVRTHRCDVVLCDVMMPSGGAEAWLAQCSQIDPQLDQRTILVTGGPTTAAAAALLESRADKVLLKPVEMSVLRPLIERTARG
ncbi:MAG: response regulator [Kofleriaceae bacterium]|nr:response regulator [Kofleriaceae bacterium]